MKKQQVVFFSDAQLLASLRRDKAWMEKHRAKYEQMRKKHLEDVKAELPLVRALRACGVKVRSVWDLVNTRDAYPKAIPVLLTHLEKSYPPQIRDGIIRALAVPEARGLAAEALLREFRKEQDQDLKWTLANTLSEVADAAVVQEVIELASEPAHGDSRQMLLVLDQANSPRFGEESN